MTKDTNCSNCRFSLPMDSEQHMCRRFPPNVLVHPAPNADQGAQVFCQFPVMLGNGWCGEYKIRLHDASKS